MFHSALNQPNRFLALGDGEFFSKVAPTPLENPHLAHFNQRLADDFNLNQKDFSNSAFTDYLAGKKPLPEQFQPFAMAYSGHQFGSFNPGLGDGRAISLCEFKDKHQQSWEFQLKGSGPTPYSRGFDGRAVLRSVIREYLGSEAIWALGIPTSRALCIVASDTPVKREKIENGAMMIRVSPSHIRFGSFERFYGQGQHPQVRALAEHCIEQHFPHLVDESDRFGLWFDEVVRTTAQMVAHWQAVGFCHGVMNTDNFSILGITFDYGPFGFMERYDPGHVCNHSDHEGRYAFDQQPRMAFWNCLCLGQALTPLIDRDRLEQGLTLFEPKLQAHYLKLLRAKLGLEQDLKQDSNLITALLALLAGENLDYTRFFRGLSNLEKDKPANHWIYQQANAQTVDEWLDQYRQRLADEDSDCRRRQLLMKQHNPKYVLRNYLAQTAIEKAEAGDYTEIEQLLTLLHSPFDEHPTLEQYAQLAPDSACGLSVSCSS
ncbi:MAG: YdiU family protein [Motiliproteus sp.]|nr:YdiU family protein [Motiliproteus sp.]